MATREFPLPKIVPDKDALQRIGNIVRKRLEADKSVYKVPTDKAEIYAVGDFMSPDECKRMMGLIDQVAKPSQLFESTYQEAFRTSYSGNVDPSNPFVRAISRRIDDLLGLNPSAGESIQGQRYLPGQEFKPHFDWFHPEGDYWKIERGRGGQRCYTAMAFLNDVEEGGTTDFTTIGISIKPKPGVLLIWNNAEPGGLPNELTMHAGTPVIKGEKYIITKWYRVRKWG
jgi:prolyl 4-hydroxylase